MKYSLLIAAGAVFLFLTGTYADEKEKGTVSFKDEIKPIFKEKCVHCHNRKTLPNRVSFESARLAFGASKTGLVYIVPGNSKKSLIITALNAPDFHEKAMPMVGVRPTKDEVALLERWIDQGAPWPKGWAGRIIPDFRAKE